MLKCFINDQLRFLNSDNKSTTLDSFRYNIADVLIKGYPKSYYISLFVSSTSNYYKIYYSNSFFKTIKYVT